MLRLSAGPCIYTGGRLEKHLEPQHLLWRITFQPGPQQRLDQPFERSRKIQLLAMVDLRRPAWELVERENAVEAAHQVSERPRLRSHVHATIWLDGDYLPDRRGEEATKAPAVVDLCSITVPGDGVDGADLEVGLLILLGIEHELVDVPRRAVDHLGSFSCDHRSSSRHPMSLS